MVKVYTVFDSASESYMRPFFEVARGAALRGFIQVAADDKTAIGKHPQDFTLFELGEYDELTAAFKMYESKIPLGTALELRGAK